MKRKSEILQKEKSFDDNITTLQNKKNIIIKNITIPSSGWKVSNFNGIPAYFYIFYSDDINQYDVVDLNISAFQLLKGESSGIYPFTFASEGSLELFADISNKPIVDLDATVIIQKGV